MNYVLQFGIVEALDEKNILRPQLSEEHQGLLSAISQQVMTRPLMCTMTDGKRFMMDAWEAEEWGKYVNSIRTNYTNSTHMVCPLNTSQVIIAVQLKQISVPYLVHECKVSPVHLLAALVVRMDYERFVAKIGHADDITVWMVEYKDCVLKEMKKFAAVIGHDHLLSQRILHPPQGEDPFQILGRVLGGSARIQRLQRRVGITGESIDQASGLTAWIGGIMDLNNDEPGAGAGTGAGAQGECTIC